MGLEEKQKFAGLDILGKAFSVGGITLGAKAGRDIKDHGKDSAGHVQVSWVSRICW